MRNSKQCRLLCWGVGVGRVAVDVIHKGVGLLEVHIKIKISFIFKINFRKYGAQKFLNPRAYSQTTRKSFFLQ